jgi:AcrR family transcriptional regulator
MPRGGSDTRAEIIRIGMRLFVEQGYDKTSLREIAEELGVTKAALYYHFRTKEDIVGEAMADYAARVQAIIDWLGTAADDPQRNEKFVDRLLELISSDGGTVLRFGQTNPTVMARDDFGGAHVGQLAAMITGLAGPEPGPEATTRATLAFGALMMGTLQPLGNLAIGAPSTPEERLSASRRVALELLAGLPPSKR